MEGCQLDCEFKGLDVLPLVSAAHPTEAMAGAQRLRLNGRMQFDGQLEEASSGREASVYAGEAAPSRCCCCCWCCCSCLGSLRTQVDGCIHDYGQLA